MQNEELDGGEEEGNRGNSNSNSNSKEGEEREDEEKGRVSSLMENRSDMAAAPATLSIVISQPEEAAKGCSPRSTEDKNDKVEAAKKGCLSRSESYHEQCRVCQQQTDEPLMDLGCRCRGELAKAHRSCIDIWFHTRGSNKCEICQQVAANVPSPEAQPSTNYWVWRVNPGFGGPNMGRGEHERGCFSPLWVAFSILIGGLLLDVLISVSLGVSALPVNIIIGVLIVLGLGTALRLALECCHEWSMRRNLRRANTIENPGFHPAV